MKVQVQFICIIGLGGSLYRVDNAEQLSADLLTVDCHGNNRLVETLGFHGAPLRNGEVLTVIV